MFCPAKSGKLLSQPLVPSVKISKIRTKRHAVEGPDAEALKKAMQDPQFAERMKEMQKMMQRPEVMEQVKQMEAVMRNQNLQKRMAELKDDPELAPMFAEIQKGGMAALQKYWNDPKFLAKIGEKVGDVAPVAPSGAAAAAPAPGPPEIDNLLDAAKYGDLEAVEDFIAIGKDVNMADKESRTPLHYAAAYAHSEVAALLLESGSKLELVDSMGNTPLHYAAGYGRKALVEQLLEAGASAAAKNKNGKSPADLIKMEPRNPLHSDTELIAQLEKA